MKEKALLRLRDSLIARSAGTPYFHLHHADGSPYMRRFWLVPESMLRPIEEAAAAKPKLVPEINGFELRDDVRHLPAARLHHICTADLDREFHTHPWSFISIVLSGGYIERRPLHADPVWEFTHFDKNAASLDDAVESLRMQEMGVERWRRPGSIAFRRHSDRHRIVHVEPDTWTLVLQGPKKPGRSWGFYTYEHGFVNWREFQSVHNTTAIQ